MSSEKIILVQDRNDNYHLVDFCAPSGRKYTLCDQMYSHKTIINTLTIDGSFDGICTKCKEIYDEGYGVQSVNNRHAKGSLQDTLTSNYTQARYQISDKEMGQLDRMDRVWSKLNRYKRKLRSDQRK